MKKSAFLAFLLIATTTIFASCSSSDDNGRPAPSSLSNQFRFGEENGYQTFDVYKAQQAYCGAGVEEWQVNTFQLRFEDNKGRSVLLMINCNDHETKTLPAGEYPVLIPDVTRADVTSAGACEGGGFFGNTLRGIPESGYVRVQKSGDTYTITVDIDCKDGWVLQLNYQGALEYTRNMRSYFKFDGTRYNLSMSEQCYLEQTDEESGEHEFLLRFRNGRGAAASFYIHSSTSAGIKPGEYSTTSANSKTIIHDAHVVVGESESEFSSASLTINSQQGENMFEIDGEARTADGKTFELYYKGTVRYQIGDEEGDGHDH